MLPLTLACSACGDMIFRSQYWWADGFGPIVLSLFLDAVVLGIASRVLKQPAKASRTFFVVPALGLPLALTLMGIGTVVGVWALVAVALAATLRSVAANRGLGGAVTVARVSLVGAAMVAGLVTQWPARRETAELARIAAYVTMLHRDDGWVFAELKARPDAATELAALFRDAERLNAPQAVVLHARFGFPAAERAEACGKLKARKAEALRGACDGLDSPLPDPLPQRGEGGDAGVSDEGRGAR